MCKEQDFVKEVTMPPKPLLGDSFSINALEKEYIHVNLSDGVSIRLGKFRYLEEIILKNLYLELVYTGNGHWMAVTIIGNQLFGKLIEIDDEELSFLKRLKYLLTNKKKEEENE